MVEGPQQDWIINFNEREIFFKNETQVETMGPSIDKNSVQFLAALEDEGQWMQWQNNKEIRGLCLCGRSNVGKSSLINALYGGKTAKTSKTPGRTRQIIVFNFFLQYQGQSFGPFYLFDLPGFGFSKVSKEMMQRWDKLMGAFFKTLGGDVLIVHLQDARHPMQEKDREFQKFVAHFPQKKVLVFNKVDKFRNQRERLALQQTQKTLQEEAQESFSLSVQTRMGLDTFENRLMEFLKSFF